MHQIDISNLGKIATMLAEEKFWSIVAKSLANSENQEEQEQELIKEIAQLSPKEMIGFRLRTDKLLHDTYTFKTREGNYPPIVFNWKEETPETMKTICPRLFEEL